jgi:hypothetical protein
MPTIYRIDYMRVRFNDALGQKKPEKLVIVRIFFFVLVSTCMFSVKLYGQAPIVITRPATNILQFSADLVADIYPDREGTYAYFEWGTHSGVYTMRTIDQFEPVFGIDTIHLSTRVRQFYPYTTYYYRLVASHYGDTTRTFGNEQYFTTQLDSGWGGILIPLSIRFNVGIQRSLYFGVHTAATSNLDIDLGELEYPPYGPCDNDIRWYDPHVNSDRYGWGSRIDFRHYDDPAQVDTYKINFTACDGYPVTISWSGIREHYNGSVTLSSGELGEINMLDQDSMVITSGSKNLFLIAQGPTNLTCIVADSVSSNNAQLRATFNINGQPTAGWFEWGTSVAFGESTEVQYFADSLNLGSVTAKVENLQPNTKYHFRLNILNGGKKFSGPKQTFETKFANGVNEQADLPERFQLLQNYPNPFNPTTTINYQLSTQSHVTLKVFNVLGREVATLVNAVEQPGYKLVSFNGTKLSSGLYFYRLTAGSYIKTKKLLLLR